MKQLAKILSIALIASTAAYANASAGSEFSANAEGYNSEYGESKEFDREGYLEDLADAKQDYIDSREEGLLQLSLLAGDVFGFGYTSDYGLLESCVVSVKTIKNKTYKRSATTRCSTDPARKKYCTHCKYKVTIKVNGKTSTKTYEHEIATVTKDGGKDRCDAKIAGWKSLCK